MLRKWIKDTLDATNDLRRANEFLPIEAVIDLFFDIFVDGQWGWAVLGRNFQVLFVTLTHPRTGRGFVVHAAIMDVKSTEDYAEALRPFAKELLDLLKAAGADGDNVRVHCDEEDAVIAALAKLIGGSVVLCRFHKAQNLERHLKIAFSKKRFVCLSRCHVPFFSLTFFLVLAAGSRLRSRFVSCCARRFTAFFARGSLRRRLSRTPMTSS
jgi:hypothetical protein